MASLEKYQTKSGETMWRYVIEAGTCPKTGKRKKISKRGFKTRKEAQKASVILEQQLIGNDYIEKSTVTFNEVYILWRKQHELDVKPSTFYAVGKKFNKHILPYFGELAIQNITKVQCQRFVEKLATTPLNKRTSKTKRPSKNHPIVERTFKSVADYKMYASQIFKFAVEEGLIKNNPMQYVKVPKTNDCHYIDKDTEKNANFWDKESALEFLKVLGEHGNDFDKIYFKLLLHTGLRKAEGLALLWEDVDFDNETITVNKTLYFQGGEFKLLKPKSEKSTRIIKLDTELCSQLREIRTARFSNDTKRNPNTCYVFERLYNIPFRLPYPNERLNILIEKGNLERITVHGLRHTHATLLFEAGATIKEVQERLGHSDFKMTMDIYTHVTNKAKEETTLKFSNFLNN